MRPRNSCAFAPWFSASAVAPLLQADWSLGRLDLPFLTIAVQLGFAAGALVLAATGAADVVPGRYLLAGGATVAAIANLGFAWLGHDVATALPFRVATGAALAGVYPIASRSSPAGSAGTGASPWACSSGR